MNTCSRSPSLTDSTDHQQKPQGAATAGDASGPESWRKLALDNDPIMSDYERSHFQGETHAL
jgi:hypothetical protein